MGLIFCRYGMAPGPGGTLHRGDSNPFRRQSLPKSFRRASVLDTVAIRTTVDAENSLKNGTLHFVVNAVKNTTLFVEIEILDGNLYHGAFDLFADTLRWGVRAPKRVGAPKDYQELSVLSKYRKDNSYIQGPHAFAAVLVSVYGCSVFFTLLSILLFPVVSSFKYMQD